MMNPHLLRNTALSLSAALALAATLPALYIRPEIEKVPVARLVENLEAHLKKEPKDVQARFNLARLHAMAYSLKTDTTEMRKGQEKEGAWFGYEPRPVPFDTVVKTEDAARQDAARKHLEKAINLYEEVVKQKPDHLIAQLGRAWAIAQRGKKEEAVKEYRKVAELAWTKEKDMKFAPLGWYAITAETGKYLVPLLDSDKDKEEIATLKKRAEQLSKIPRPITPIALPLRDGMTPSEMLDTSARVRFDADGSGLAHEWTWIHKDAGWLVHDPAKMGKITSALQLFGGVSFWCFWDNGYQALAALDDDGDGWLRGNELAGLAIWRDANCNGISDPGEVKPLSEWGIIALRCRADASPTAPQCAAQAIKGVVFKDGSIRPTFDLVLRSVVAQQDVEPPPPPPAKAKNPFAARKSADRDKNVKDNGGSAESEVAVAKGLLWLALHQAPDGSWSMDHFHLHARQDLKANRYGNDNSTGRGQKNDTAGAAFGVLPFLAAGITHKVTGQLKQDQYSKTVQRGLTYLVGKQARDGSFPGGMYAHGLAAITLCEAYGMTADPALKRSAQAALNYIISAQDPQGGGWRYTPRQAGDTSVLGWQMAALKAGQAAGLNVPAATLKRAEKYLDSAETQDGGFSYTPGAGATPTMTAVGWLCRMYLGTPAGNAKLVKGIESLHKLPPPDALRNVYHCYYATQVMFHVGGENWEKWNNGADQKKGMRDLLIERQDKDGSWDPKGDAYSTMGGRIMQTSLSLLTLEVYYRHAPLFRREK